MAATESTEIGELIIFERDTSLDDFINRNRPSRIENSRHPWIAVHNPRRPFPKNRDGQDRDSLLEEWEHSKENLGMITADFVQHLAEKYDYKTGKWLIYCKSSRIDGLWKVVARAVFRGKLGFAAKVSTLNPEDKMHVICVYTEDFTNEEEVRAVEQGLRQVGITARMLYKPDIYTTLGIYRKNPWKLRPTVYTSS